MSRGPARGAATLEFCAVAPVLVAVVAITLGAGYFVLARAWLEYSAEQALYCLAEGRDPRACARTYTLRINERLSFGRVTSFAAARAPERWTVRIGWRVAWPRAWSPGPVRVNVARTLTLARARRHGVR